MYKYGILGNTSIRSVLGPYNCVCAGRRMVSGFLMLGIARDRVDEEEVWCICSKVVFNVDVLMFHIYIFHPHIND